MTESDFDGLCMPIAHTASSVIAEFRAMPLLETKIQTKSQYSFFLNRSCLHGIFSTDSKTNNNNNNNNNNIDTNDITTRTYEVDKLVPSSVGGQSPVVKL